MSFKSLAVQVTFSYLFSLVNSPYLLRNTSYITMGEH